MLTIRSFVSVLLYVFGTPFNSVEQSNEQSDFKVRLASKVRNLVT